MTVEDRGPKPSRTNVMAAFAAVYIVWGSTYLAIRYAVSSIPPFLMGGSRFVLAGALLYGWARMRGAPKPTRAQWRAALITGVLLLVGGNGAVIWAEQHVASGLVALIVAVVPLWIVVFDWLRPGGTRPVPAVFIGVGLGLFGLALLIGPDALASHGASRLNVAAALVPVIGAMLWALGSIFSRYAPRPTSAQLATGMQMLMGGSAFLVVSLIAGEPHRFSFAGLTTAAVVGWLYLVTFGALVGFTAYIYLLRASTPAKAATYAYVNPIVAVILGSAVAGEPFTPRMAVAAAIILGAVAMITLANSRKTAEVPNDEPTEIGARTDSAVLDRRGRKVS